MVAAKERCLLSREAHPKAHDISARNTGSQKSLWHRTDRKPDHKHGQTTRQEREETNGRPVVVANRFAEQSGSST